MFLLKGPTTEVDLREACRVVVDSDPASDLMLLTSYAV